MFHKTGGNMTGAGSVKGEDVMDDWFEFDPYEDSLGG